MSLRHVWAWQTLKRQTHSLEEENTRKYIWNVAFLKKLHIKWVIKMIDQSQVTPEEVQFKQVALWEAYVLQLAPEKVQVPDIDEVSIIYLYIEKNGIEILLSSTIYFLSK